MKNKNIFILLLTLFTSFSVGDLTHADLDSSQVLGEMPGYFFMDDEFWDNVYVWYARYPDDYTLLNYFDKENYTNIFFDIPISNQYTLSTLWICQISGWCNKDSYFNPYIAQITQTLDDYNIYSISLSNVNKWSNYWGNWDLMKLSFTDNSSMVFKFLIPHDTVFDGILNTYISDYYYDDSSYGYIDLFLLEDDRRLNLAADMEVELVDDNFQLSNLNYPINKSYLLVRDNIVDDDIKNEYTYSLDWNNVSIEIPNYDEDEYWWMESHWRWSWWFCIKL